ncbi:hypothetical protein [Botrimarina sp.]|uniref:hypothetical protein n=1 Tax=Botrimarina sp. TaxID=2795802 RepID=UPI0032EDD538
MPPLSPAIATHATRSTMPDDRPLPRLPAEPLRRMDWPAVAPWLLLLRVPEAVAGWPMVVGGLAAAAIGSAAADAPLGPARPWLVAAHVWSGVFNYREPSAWGVVAAVLWVAIGAAIIRITALRLTRAAGRGVFRSLLSGIRSTPSVLAAAALLAAPAGLVAAVLWSLAALTRLVGGPPLAEALAPLGFVFAAIPLAVLTLAAVVGLPIALAATAVDGADAFDAASRAFAYATQRVARLAWYAAIAAAVGLLTTTLLEAALGLAAWLLAVVTGAEGMLREPTGWFARAAVRLARGYYPAYAFASFGAVYLLLRRDIDGQPIDELNQPAQSPAA